MLYNKIRYTLCILCIGSGVLWSQQGSLHVFNFLNLSPSPNVSSLGGQSITNATSISNAFINPAILSDLQPGRLSLNHSFYYSDIHFSSLNFSFDYKDQLLLHAGLIRADYGKIEGLDEFGMPIGKVGSSDNALVLGIGKQIFERIQLGLNLKIIQSNIGFDQSFGIASDFGINYKKSSNGTIIGLLFKNMGTQVTTYTQEGKKEKLPFDIVLGISKRLKHVPIRFSVNYRSLNRWNIITKSDDNEGGTSLFVTQENDIPPLVDNFFRHLSFGSEVLIGKNEQLQLRLGYNHKVRKELGISEYFSLAGFSMGFGVKLRKMDLDFSRNINHISGGANQLGIRFNVKEIIKN